MKPQEEYEYIGLNTTTVGKRSDGMPPGGNENSLLGDPPFARYGLELTLLLELATLPFPTAFEGSTFMSAIFFTFFSCTCSQ